MSFPARPFAPRSAFLLNANARAVNDRLIEQLAEVVPAGDLFLSRTLDDAEVFVRTIARRGYGQVFFGGGDGTLVTTMDLLRKAVEREGLQMPKVGVLRLGTGNAMAKALGCDAALIDASHVVHKGGMTTRPVHLVEDENGVLTPFAGMGYDGAVLNDYCELRQSLKDAPVLRKVTENVWGYIGAMLFRTVPREARQPLPHVKVTTKSDAYLVVSTPEGDVEQLIPAGSVLFEGKAPIISVGAIPFFGYGFTMFPFASRKPGYIQLRIGAIPIPVILAHLWPSIWKGSFRHPMLKDFLVKDVVVESDRELPYQLGGDAAGHKKRLEFKVAKEAIDMIELDEKRLVPQGHTVLQLGPARLLVRLPR